MAIKQLVYAVVHPALGSLARNRLLIHRLFGVRIPKDVTVHFDPTTWLLGHALRHIATPADQRALEVGIGQGALLALGLAATRDIEVDGIDCSESRVQSSRIVAKYNDVTSHFFQSDLFESVPDDRDYDLIFFNPPYVSTGEGRRMKLTERMRADGDRVWDGGEDGTTVLRAFLQQAPRYLSQRGRVLFGVQGTFVPEENVRAAVDGCDLSMLERFTRCCVPSVVYILNHSSRDSKTLAR